MARDSLPDQRARGCAANYCRKAGTVWLVKGKVRLTLCDVHARVFRGLGYEDEDSRTPDETLLSPEEENNG